MDSYPFEWGRVRLALSRFLMALSEKAVPRQDGVLFIPHPCIIQNASTDYLVPLTRYLMLYYHLQTKLNRNDTLS